MNIYISTGQNKTVKTSKLLRLLLNKNISKIELSAGPYEKNILNKISKYRNEIQIHNYFPVPKNPFIINLASKNDLIYKLSQKHLKKSINFAKKTGSKVFSFHAGFLVDPRLEDFGKTLSKFKTNNKSEVMKLYINRLNQLADFAKKKGVTLLIENNVITKKNLNRFDKNPFLMTNFSDTKKIMENTRENVGLLVDVAHLKVSAKALNFNPENYLIKTIRWTKGYHLSDNDGISDQNKNLKYNSWFWKFLSKKVGFVTLELKNLKNENILSQLKLVKNKLSTKKS